jgi:predicted ATPase
MISKVRLRNFKCYADSEFSFSNLTVFCGNNSVGKSTAIQSMLLAIQSDFSETGIPINGEFVSIGTYSDIHKRNADEDSVYFEVGNENGSYTWGHDLDNPDDPHYAAEGYSQRKAAMDEQPLPLMKLEGDGCDSIKESLKNNFQYLSAERLGPKSYYPYSHKRRAHNWLGVQGEYCAQVLSDIGSLGDLIEHDPRRHKNARVLSVSNSIHEWMGDISPGVFVNSTSIKQADIATTLFEFNSEGYRPFNVGFGLSYSLPIIMALLMTKPGGLVIIENPEAHLHPKGQSYLGRLIALAAQSGVQVIVETHSDHVINGIRLMPRLGLVDCSKITIYQVFTSTEGSEVQGIFVDEKGQLTEWPEEFFDQHLIDMDIMMKGKDK